MKKTCLIRAVLYFAVIQQVGAMEVKDTHLEMEESCYVNPSQKEVVVNTEILSQPHISNLLEQRHPGGTDNDIVRVNQDRGEGLPYSIALRFLQGYPPDQHPEISEKISALWHNIPENLQKAEILRIIQGVPLGDYEKIIEQVGLILRDITDKWERATILDTIVAIPLQERRAILEQATPLVKGIANTWDRTRFFQDIIIKQVEGTEKFELIKLGEGEITEFSKIRVTGNNKSFKNKAIKLGDRVFEKPWSCNFCLEFFYANVNGSDKSRTYFGSGILINYHTLLTAGHNLYDKHGGGYPDRINCFAACFENNSLAAASVEPVKKPESIFVPTSYITSRRVDKNLDIGLIFFDNETANVFKSKIGYVATPMNYSHFSPEQIQNIEFYITGYPYTTPGKRYAHTMSGKVYKHGNNSALVHYDIDTGNGYSGAGICFQDDDGRVYSIGVHAYSPAIGENFRTGILLNDELSSKSFEFILSQQQKEVLEWATPFLENVVDNWKRIEVLEAISMIPMDFVEKILPFLKDIIDPQERIEIIKILSDTPLGGHDSILKIATILSTNLRNPHVKSENPKREVKDAGLDLSGDCSW